MCMYIKKRKQTERIRIYEKHNSNKTLPNTKHNQVLHYKKQITIVYSPM